MPGCPAGEGRSEGRVSSQGVVQAARKANATARGAAHVVGVPKHAGVRITPGALLKPLHCDGFALFVPKAGDQTGCERHVSYG